MDPEVAGVFVTDDKVSQFVRRGGTPTARVTVQADNRDRDVIVNYRSTFAGNLRHEDQQARKLAELREGINGLEATAEVLAQP